MIKYILDPKGNYLIKIDSEAESVDLMDTMTVRLDKAYLMPQDGILSYKGEETQVHEGNVILTTYYNEFPNKVIVLNGDNTKLKENNDAAIAYEQARKEEWAAKYTDDAAEINGSI